MAKRIPQANEVGLSAHALQRWREYTGQWAVRPRRVRNIVRAELRSQLRTGCKPKGGLIFDLYLDGYHLFAVVGPNQQKPYGWTVITFYPDQELQQALEEEEKEAVADG